MSRPDLVFGSGADAVGYFAVPVFVSKGEATRTLYALEWVNPRPEVTIRSVDFVGTRAVTSAAPVLAAITAVR